MCLFSFLTLLILLCIFYYSLKSKINESEESVHARLSLIESKIDEINVVMFSFGNAIKELHNTKNERKSYRVDTKSQRKTGRKRPDASEQMKRRWREKREAKAAAEKTLRKIEEELSK